PGSIYLHLTPTPGRRVAEMHRAFATPTGDPAFAPEPVETADLARWAEGVRVVAERARTILQTRRDTLPEASRPQPDDILPNCQAVHGPIRSLIPESAKFVKTRLHGDLHLGQVLLCKDDFSIIDFEGEPSRPLQERRVKHCILKDVAGMLRSFDYAAAAAVGGQLELRTQDPEALTRAAREWQRSAEESFLGGYREAIGDCPSYPGPEAALKLTQLFLLDKALYEIGYEAAHRPNWIGIPLGGLARVLGAVL